MQTTQKPVLFYDGGCPLCRKEIRHYQKLDHAGAIDWIDITTSAERLAAYHIDYETAMRRVHAISPSGKVVTGVHAFRTIWQKLPYYRHLDWLIGKLRLTTPLDYCYMRFADWRYRRRCKQCDITSRH